MAVSDIFGNVAPPPGVSNYGLLGAGGLVKFANNLLKFILVIGGLYALLNIILAGWSFLSAGGDSKKVEQAWAKIWQSLVGLLVMAGAFVLAAIFGWLLFGDPMFILNPKISGP